MNIKKNCAISGREFLITDADQRFYEKMGVSTPTLCPKERQRQRLIFRNLRKLYHRKCDATGKQIISCYAPDVPHKVYHADYWWSDKWDGLAYGREFDFTRPFFEQFLELYRDVPLLHNFAISNENCEYINGAGYCKDCYLCFNLDHCDSCYYLMGATGNTSCGDCLELRNSELCYECINCINCYNVCYSQRCIGCSDSYFLSDCRNCKNCIGCFNLIGQEYHIFNKKVSPEEFEAKRKELENAQKINQVSGYLKQFKSRFPKKFYFGHSNEDFSGENLQNVKNSHYCFDSFEIENCRYCNYIFKAKNCMDYDYFGNNSEWIYNCLATGVNCTENICCMSCWAGSSNNYYCHLINATNNCFGCSGLKNQSYCVLNKKYSKEEYENLVPKIIEHMKQTGEWGEFFPASHSPFGHNEALSHEFFPLTKEECIQRGLKWKEDDTSAKYQGATYQPPNTIEDVPDEVLKAILTCETCQKNYRIVKPELGFYRKMKLPIPKQCPNCRYDHRLSLHYPKELYERSCDKCQKDIQTTFSADRPEKVYCEACYLKEVN